MEYGYGYGMEYGMEYGMDRNDHSAGAWEERFFYNSLASLPGRGSVRVISKNSLHDCTFSCSLPSCSLPTASQLPSPLQIQMYYR